MEAYWTDQQILSITVTDLSSQASEKTRLVQNELTFWSRKKYAKQKINFERAMRESNSLFREEMRILELSRRLKEQNE
jgi:hypothetical protein